MRFEEDWEKMEHYPKPLRYFWVKRMYEKELLDRKYRKQPKDFITVTLYILDLWEIWLKMARQMRRGISYGEATRKAPEALG